MLGRSHQICSIAIVQLCVTLTQPITLHNVMPDIILLFSTGVGALIPDIDQKKSTASKKSPVKLSPFLSHRGITHTLLGWLIFTGVLYFLMQLLYPFDYRIPQYHTWWLAVWLGLIIGYLLHLVEDSFSHQGVQWLAPFIKKKHRKKFFSYKVGGPFEKWLVTLASLSISVMSLLWIWQIMGSQFL